MNINIKPKHPLESFGDAPTSPVARASISRGHVNAEKRNTYSRGSTKNSESSSSGTPPPQTQPRAHTQPTRVGWVSQGSEAEISDVGSTRERIKLSIARRRRDFGQTGVRFSDRDAHDGLVEWRAFKNPYFELESREDESAVQAVPHTSEASSQTAWHRKVNAACQYESPELSAELCSAALRAPSLVSFMGAFMEPLRLALMQNEAIRLFHADFPVIADEEASLLGGKADNVLREIQSFTDLRHSKDKVIACVGWMPQSKGVVAVSCLENASFDDRVTQSGKVRSSLILIWNFVDPIHPQAVLEAPSDVTTMKFHPSIPTTLVAGCANGQILYYDLSTSLRGPTSYQPLKEGEPAPTQRSTASFIPYTVASSIEASHRAAVTDLVWLPSSLEVNKTRSNANIQDPPKGDADKSVSGSKVTQPAESSSQFITIATDGQLLLWDIRFKKDIKEMDLFWTPLYRMNLTRADMREELTLSTISLKNNSTKIVAATEDGELVLSDWGPIGDGTKVQSTIYPWHQGPVRSLERSPFFEDIILTVGDWSIAVWKEGAGSQPLLSSPYSTTAVTVGRWSPTRPGVFYVGHADGTIAVWDLIDKAHVPTLTQPMAEGAITSMEFGGLQMLVGDAVGTLHQLELPKNLVRALPSERPSLSNFFAREAVRLRSWSDAA